MECRGVEVGFDEDAAAGVDFPLEREAEHDVGVVIAIPASVTGEQEVDGQSLEEGS